MIQSIKWPASSQTPVPAPSPLSAAPEDPQDKLVANEARFFGQNLLKLWQQPTTMGFFGIQSAVRAFTKNPAVGPKAAEYLARLTLMNAEREEDMYGTAETPANQRAVAEVVLDSARETLEQSRKCKTSPLQFNTFLENSSVLLARPGVAAALTIDEQKEIQRMYEACLNSSALDSELHVPRGWIEVESIARGSAAMDKASGGAVSSQWVLDWLADKPHPEDVNVYPSRIYLRTAVDAGRPISDTVLNTAVTEMLDEISDPQRKEFAWSFDLEIIGDAYRAKGDRKGLDEVAERFRHTSYANLVGDDLYGRSLGTDSTESAPGPYVRKGQADRAQAVAGISASTAFEAEDFWDKAGDEAILALGDPKYADQARGDLVTLIVGKPGTNLEVDIHGEFNGSLLKAIVGRMPALQAHNPADYDAARSGVMDVMERVLRNERQDWMDIKKAVFDPLFTSDEQLHLLSIALENARKQQSDKPYEDDPIYKRGDILYSMANLVPQAISGLAASDLDGVRQVADATAKLVSDRVARIEKYAEESPWKEKSTVTRQLVGMGDT